MVVSKQRLACAGRPLSFSMSPNQPHRESLRAIRKTPALRPGLKRQTPAPRCGGSFCLGKRPIRNQFSTPRQMPRAITSSWPSSSWPSLPSSLTLLVQGGRKVDSRGAGPRFAPISCVIELRRRWCRNFSGEQFPSERREQPPVRSRASKRQVKERSYAFFDSHVFASLGFPVRSNLA